jgi:predicted nucleic acid-binding Zn ribbon protein
MFSPVPIIFKGSGFYVTDHPGTHANSASTDKVAEKATESSKAAGDSKD